MGFSLHSAPKNTDFTENRSAFPQRDCDLFFACLTVYFVHRHKEAVRLTVYLDLVFALNLAVNYLLLRTAARLGAAAIRNRRLLLGALIGAVYAVLVWLPPLHWLTAVPCKLLCAGMMLITAFGVKRSTLRLAAVFGGITLVLCGAVYGVALLQNGAVRYREDALFYPVSFFTLLLTAAAVSLASRLLLPRLTHAPDSLVPVTVQRCGRAVQLTALRDSGNTLCDPISGASVLTVYWQAAKRLFPADLSLAAEDFTDPAALALRLQGASPRLIPYRAVGVSSGLLLALPCEITIGKETKLGLVAFSPTPVSDGGAYDALTGGVIHA